MKKETRFKFNAFLSQLAKLNNVEPDTLSKKFDVEPSVTQTLMTRLQESSEFLTRINIIPVDEMMGAKVGVGVTGTIASTANTDGGDERETADFTKLDQEQYHCTKTNYDFHWMYNKLDLWARYNDFQTRLRDAIIKRQALDRILVGFNGVSRAPTSNRIQNPLLQDVGVGWLQKYRLNAPQRVLGSKTDADGKTTAAPVKVGGDNTYKNLDAVVFDAVNELIDPVFQDDTDLVVICGRKLLADKYFPLVNKNQANTETLAADLIVSQKRIGNLPAVRVPGFPANAMFVTRLDTAVAATKLATARKIAGVAFDGTQDIGLNADNVGAFPRAGGDVNGRVTANYLRAITIPHPGDGQGTYLGWNESGGQGESNFVNNRGGGVGGFKFRIVNQGNTVQTGEMTLSGNGDSNTSGTVNEMGQRVFSPNNRQPVNSNTANLGGGWWRCGDTGMIKQWGVVNKGSRGWSTVNFPIPFPSTCVNVQVTAINGGGGTFNDNFGTAQIINNIGFTCGQDSGGSYWEATGW